MTTAPSDEEWEQYIAAHQAGQLEKAEAFYRRVLASDPNNPDALNLLGTILQVRHEWEAAAEMFEHALRAEAHFPEALINLAMALRETGRGREAAAAAAKAIELAPDMPEAWIQAGLAGLVLEDLPSAIAAFRHAATLAPASLEAHVNLGVAAAKSKDFSLAVRALKQALELDPARSRTLRDLGSAHLELGETDEAIACLKRAIDQTPDDIAAHALLVRALSLTSDASAAAEACRAALHLAPDRPELWTFLGSSLACLGQFDEAADSHRRALELNPDAMESQRELAVLHQDKANPELVARLEATLHSDAPAQDRISAGFSLGDLLDQNDDFDGAFAAYAAANALVLQVRAKDGIKYSRVRFAYLVNHQIRCFPPGFRKSSGLSGHHSELPVFVVGMPRSGTTLVEQIAASHSAVFGAGELYDVSQLVDRLNSRTRYKTPAEWPIDQFAEETAAHIEKLKKLGGSASRVIDKMPDNIISLGQIALLFPNARVIICRRDPRDIALSCYTKRFSRGMEWTNDLADIASRLTEVDRLRNHWLEALPLRVLEICYEDLVADLPGQSRRLIEFLGLDWEPACLEFHKTERQVFTASRWQVRQPIYTNAVERWRNYEKHLAPLLASLAVPLSG